MPWLPDSVGVKPHDYRRFVGTQLAEGDIRKAQKALCHKPIDTTARHYVLDELEPGMPTISTDPREERPRAEIPTMLGITRPAEHV